VFTVNEGTPELDIVVVNPLDWLSQPRRRQQRRLPHMDFGMSPFVQPINIGLGGFPCKYQELTANESPAEFVEAAYGVAEEMRGGDGADGGTSEWMEGLQ
jgi:hypothetical protein